MAIRLNPEQVLKAVFVALLLVWALLWATGCATTKVDRLTAELSLAQDAQFRLEAALAQVIDESASPTTTAGDNATITNVNVGTGIGCMAMMLVLGLLAWRHRTAVGTVDRLIRAIKKEATAPFCYDKQILKDHKTAVKSLTQRIEALGHPIDPSKPDRQERFLRSRLKRTENV